MPGQPRVQVDVVRSGNTCLLTGILDGILRHGIGFQSSRLGDRCDILWENDYPPPGR